MYFGQSSRVEAELIKEYISFFTARRGPPVIAWRHVQPATATTGGGAGRHEGTHITETEAQAHCASPAILYGAKSAAISGQLERALQLAAMTQFPLPEGLGRLLFKDITTCPQDDSPHTSYTYMVKIVQVPGSQRYLDPEEKMLESFKGAEPRRGGGGVGGRPVTIQPDHR